MTGGENRIARRQRVGDGRFPGAGPRRREDDRFGGPRLQDALDAIERGTEHLHKGRRTVVDGREIDRAAQMVGQIGRAGNEDRILHCVASLTVSWRASAPSCPQTTWRKSPLQFF